MKNMDKVRVIVDSAESSQDYWITKQLADTMKFELPTISVYANERTFYDPDKRYFHMRIR
jgi:hypothetical protein